MNNNLFVFLSICWRDKKFCQKGGVVLLVTIVVMGIIIAIVLGVSVILLSELKMIRGIGNSVVAFYVADTGVEKTLYYDRKQIPIGGTRGICNICASGVCPDCISCGKVGDHCSPGSCTDCVITYTTYLTNEPSNRMFKMVVTVSPGNDIYQSYGEYNEVTRAIELSGS